MTAAISPAHPIGAAARSSNRVVARFRRHRGWFHGVVRATNDDGTLDISFDDGDREPSAQVADVRVMTNVRLVVNELPAPVPEDWLRRERERLRRDASRGNGTAPAATWAITASDSISLLLRAASSLSCRRGEAFFG